MICEISIEDKEVIDYIQTIDDSELDSSLEKLLKLGILVKNTLNVSLNVDQIITPMYDKMNTIFNTNNPMMQQMQNLNNTIEDLKGSSKASVGKGKIGENCICDNVQRYFPSCELKDTANQAHQSDFQFSMENCPNILVEVKTYKNNVPSEQIEKLKKDLKFTGFKAAIMISTTSGISKKKQFSWETTDDNIIVYLPNGGLDGYSIIWAILFIKELHRYKESDKYLVKGYEISQKLENLRQIIIDMEHTKSIMRMSKSNMMNSIEVSFENMNKQIFNIDNKIKNFIHYFETF